MTTPIFIQVGRFIVNVADIVLLEQVHHPNAREEKGRVPFHQLRLREGTKIQLADTDAAGLTDAMLRLSTDGLIVARRATGCDAADDAHGAEVRP